jgi:hypothetical protein
MPVERSNHATPSMTMITPTSSPIISIIALNVATTFTSFHWLLLLPAKGTIEKI